VAAGGTSVWRSLCQVGICQLETAPGVARVFAVPRLRVAGATLRLFADFLCIKPALVA